MPVSKPDVEVLNARYANIATLLPGLSLGPSPVRPISLG
jgi:hypothetical protein